MKRILDHVIPPKLGFGLVVKKGQSLRVIDLEGKQVVDMALFNAENPRERLSTSNSRTRYVPKPGAEYVPRDKLTEGDTLMSTLCRPMMTFVLILSEDVVSGSKINVIPVSAPTRRSAKP